MVVVIADADKTCLKCNYVQYMYEWILKKLNGIECDETKNCAKATFIRRILFLEEQGCNINVQLNNALRSFITKECKSFTSPCNNC